MRTLVTVVLVLALLAGAWWAYRTFAPASVGGGVQEEPGSPGGAVYSTIGAGTRGTGATITSVGGTARLVLPGAK